MLQNSHAVVGGRWSGKMVNGIGGGKENQLVSLLLSRIRVIMKSLPEVSNINPDTIFLT
ncbi:Hypothetical predicted protein, partial [Podarcis lilfordi]